MHFSENQKLTIISVAEILQVTIRREIKITRIVEAKPVYKVKGKGKEYFFDQSASALIFDGWGVPVTIDADTASFVANGCINFVTDTPADLRLQLEKIQLNERFNRDDLIMYRKKSDTIYRELL